LAFNSAAALQFSVKRDANCRRARHSTRDRGALAHDDRIDAVAGAVAHFQRAMMMDVDQAAKAMKEAEIEDFLEGFNQPTLPRGMRVNGVRVATWSSQRGISGLSRLPWPIEALRVVSSQVIGLKPYPKADLALTGSKRRFVEGVVAQLGNNAYHYHRYYQ
jgi:hypothetical protein